MSKVLLKAARLARPERRGGGGRRARRVLRMLAGVWLFAVAGCGGGAAEPDAYGHFEADEVLVSAEAAGRLLAFHADEGTVLRAGERVGLVDTTQLALKRDGLRAQRRAVRARIAGVLAQVEVVEAQRQVALRERERLRRLLENDAATEKQLDDVEGQIRVLDRQKGSVRAQNEATFSEVDALDAQLAQLDDQIARSVVVNPVDGTVLTRYAAPHELVAYGRPLYRLGNLGTMYLRAYVSGAGLPAVRLGAPVQVRVDDGRGALRTLPGEVAWIASEAEFTPKTIQTREERVNLVYAVRVRVPNPEGVLKIGMPGEVVFARPAAPDSAAPALTRHDGPDEREPGR